MKTQYCSATSGLKYIMWICVALWILAQIAVVVIVEDIPQSSDALRYQTLAEECFNSGTWYPLKAHIENYNPETGYPTYICYPGFINLLEIYLFLFGSIKAGFWMNILFNCITIWCIWKIVKQITNRNFAYLSVIMFCLYPLPILMAGETLSEYPCIALTYLSVLLAGRKSYGWIIASAIIIIMAQYIRTTAIIFAVSVLIYMIYKKYGWKRITTYIAGCVAAIAVIINFNYNLTGYSFFSSSTLGVNMLQGANNDSKGYYNNYPSVSDEIDSMILGKNVFEIDSIHREYALTWIKNNPEHWIQLIGPKLDHEFRPSTYLHIGRKNAHIIDQNKNPDKIFVIIFKVYCYLYQYGLLILTICGLWIRRKKLSGIDGIILLPLLGGLALTILTVGNARYHLPYIPIMIYFAVWSLKYCHSLYKNKKWKFS